MERCPHSGSCSCPGSTNVRCFDVHVMFYVLVEFSVEYTRNFTILSDTNASRMHSLIILQGL